MFPMTYSKAFSQWWSSNRHSATEAQKQVLSFLPFYPESDGKRIASVNLVELSGRNRAINEVEILRKDEPVERNLVILHGYGAGLGLFYRNFDGLSSVPGTRLYALDLLGMGNSSRPHFSVHSKDPVDKIEEAEAFFIDALEEWRQAKKIDKMTLMGHSLGGYLSVNYCLKYPSHVDKLILVSPVGVPPNPFESNSQTETDPSIVNPPDTTLQSEFSQPQKPTSKKEVQQPRPLPRWVTLLWEANFSPFMFVRIPFVGPKFASGWTTRRFSQLPSVEQETLSEYAYQIFRLKGSGEFALAYLLAPGAYARRPLMERVKGLRGDGVLKRVSWIYGSYDWMDVDAGKEASELLEEDLDLVSQVHVVERAGHNVHLDNPEGFNRIIRKELNVKV